MIDYRALIHDADAIIARLQTRGVNPEQSLALQGAVASRSRAIQDAESLRQELNTATKSVQKLRGEDPTAFARAREELKSLKDRIKQAEQTQSEADETLDRLLMTIPNLPHESVPEGQDESSNRVERTVGTPKDFPFEAKAHWDLGESLGIIDFDRGAKISGSRFVVYRGLGARLEWALAQLMLDMARENGYLEIIPPLLVREDAMRAAGQYPKFKGDSFETLDEEYSLIPTSEVPLVNLHRDEILADENLPVRYVAHTPCFRREAGAAGRDTRGLIRLHQFNKVELVSITRPEDSFEELERLTRNAESVLQRLELPYRVSALSTGDMGFAAAKTYDLEVWLPGQGTYREISSCSNCTDFQARRSKIRYRPEPSGGEKTKPALVHTLNGSGLAVGRAFVAVIENYQREGGSIEVPAALRPYLGGLETIDAP
ncbi:MAG: serine--tRNA ligase [Myxococcota bacterium]